MGEVFAGRYELVDPIGRGGVGAVWRAWDHRRRRYVAAKVLQQSDAHTLLRFVREQALRIDHPHVLAPASWAADDDKVLFTMDLVSGGSLAHLIGDYGPLPPQFVCTLLDQLLAGLAAVHAEGVVHRDIKPANVLLEATGIRRPHLRLSDFGISMRKGEPRLTETNYVVGTPGYFAPEQMMGAEPDFPADLFAVGLVALYLLQGAKPDSRALVEHFAAHGTPSAPQDVPEPLWQVIAGLVQPDPQARFRTATGARKALTSAAEMLPEPGPDDELVEVFDQIGPLPAGFGPQGPLAAPPPAASGEAPGVPRPHGAEGHAPAAHGISAPVPDHSPQAPAAASAPESGFPAAGPPGQDPRQSPAPQGMPEGTQQPPHPQPGTSHGTPQGTPPPGNDTPPGTFTPTGTATGHAPAPAPGAPYARSSPLTPPDPAAPSTPSAAPASPAGPAGSAYSPPPARPGPRHAAPQQPDPSQLPTSAVPYDNSPTRAYTAQSPQVPYTPQASAPAVAAGPRRRPGPPPKVAIPVLVVALLCFAVGIWALTQS